MQIKAIYTFLTPPQRGSGRSRMPWEKGNAETFGDGWTLSLKWRAFLGNVQKTLRKPKGFAGGAGGKGYAFCTGDVSWIPGSGRSPTIWRYPSADTTVQLNNKQQTNYLFPPMLHFPLHLPTHPYLAHRTLLRCLRGSSLRKEDWFGDPSTNRPGV